jgi:hypothetical protein
MNSGRNLRLAVAAILIVLSIGMAGGGLSLAIQEQPNLKWLYTSGTLLAFISGLAAMKTALNYVRRDFQLEIEKEKKRVGRSLSEQEMEQVKARFKEKREKGETNIRFPLQRLVVRLVLLLPAAFAVSFLVAIGSFFAGLLFVLLIEEYRKHTMPYF